MLRVEPANKVLPFLAYGDFAVSYSWIGRVFFEAIGIADEPLVCLEDSKAFFWGSCVELQGLDEGG